ncbi:MAG TPA: PKD domain-containing protein [Iamia sp.]
MADFGYEVELGEVGPTYCPVAAIRFTDESTGDPTGWEWEFSDHTTSTEQNPTVRHELFEATLTVSRGDETDTVTHPVSYAVC